MDTNCNSHVLVLQYFNAVLQNVLAVQHYISCELASRTLMDMDICFQNLSQAADSPVTLSQLSCMSYSQTWDMRLQGGHKEHLSAHTQFHLQSHAPSFNGSPLMSV